MSTLVNEFQAW